MTTGSNRDRVLAVLRVSTVPLDDDQLSVTPTAAIPPWAATPPG
jgi:hypothetical protein